jgi:hypothetical protein
MKNTGHYQCKDHPNEHTNYDTSNRVCRDCKAKLQRFCQQCEAWFDASNFSKHAKTHGAATSVVACKTPSSPARSKKISKKKSSIVIKKTSSISPSVAMEFMPQLLTLSTGSSSQHQAIDLRTRSAVAPPPMTPIEMKYFPPPATSVSPTLYHTGSQQHQSSPTPSSPSSPMRSVTPNHAFIGLQQPFIIQGIPIETIKKMNQVIVLRAEFKKSDEEREEVDLFNYPGYLHGITPYWTFGPSLVSVTVVCELYEGPIRLWKKWYKVSDFYWALPESKPDMDVKFEDSNNNDDDHDDDHDRRDDKDHEFDIDAQLNRIMNSDSQNSSDPFIGGCGSGEDFLDGYFLNLETGETKHVQDKQKLLVKQDLPTPDFTSISPTSLFQPFIQSSSTQNDNRSSTAAFQNQFSRREQMKQQNNNSQHIRKQTQQPLLQEKLYSIADIGSNQLIQQQQVYDRNGTRPTMAHGIVQFQSQIQSKQQQNPNAKHQDQDYQMTDTYDTAEFVQSSSYLTQLGSEPFNECIRQQLQQLQLGVIKDHVFTGTDPQRNDDTQKHVKREQQDQFARAASAVEMQNKIFMQQPTTITEAIPIVEELSRRHNDYSTSYALLIGCSTYLNNMENLRAGSDCKNLGTVLQDIGFNVKILSNEQVTQQNVLNELFHTFRQLDANSRLIVHFSGHGQVKRQDNDPSGYFCCVDYSVKDLERTTILYKDLARFIQQYCPATEVLMSLDCCYSGSALTFGSRQSDVTPHKNRVNKSIFTITSCQDAELAHEAQQGGLYTLALCNVLNSAGDFYTVETIAERVTQLVQQVTKKRQTPTFGYLGKGTQPMVLRPLSRKYSELPLHIQKDKYRSVDQNAVSMMFIVCVTMAIVTFFSDRVLVDCMKDRSDGHVVHQFGGNDVNVIGNNVHSTYYNNDLVSSSKLYDRGSHQRRATEALSQYIEGNSAKDRSGMNCLVKSIGFIGTANDVGTFTKYNKANAQVDFLKVATASRILPHRASTSSTLDRHNHELVVSPVVPSKLELTLVIAMKDRTKNMVYILSGNCLRDNNRGDDSLPHGKDMIYIHDCEDNSTNNTFTEKRNEEIFVNRFGITTGKQFTDNLVCREDGSGITVFGKHSADVSTHIVKDHYAQAIPQDLMNTVAELWTQSFTGSILETTLARRQGHPTVCLPTIEELKKAVSIPQEIDTYINSIEDCVPGTFSPDDLPKDLKLYFMIADGIWKQITFILSQFITVTTMDICRYALTIMLLGNISSSETHEYDNNPRHLRSRIAVV